MESMRHVRVDCMQEHEYFSLCLDTEYFQVSRTSEFFRVSKLEKFLNYKAKIIIEIA